MYILKPKQTFPAELWHHSLNDVQTYALKKKLKKKSLKEQIHFYILPTIKLAERFDKYLQRTLSFTLLRLRMSSMFQRWGKSAQKISILCNCPECNPPPPIHPPGDGYKVTNTIHTTPLYQKYVHSLICLGDRGNATYDLHLLKKKGGGATWLSTTFANRVQKKWEILTFNLVAQNDNAMLSQKKNMFTLCFLTQDK